MYLFLLEVPVKDLGLETKVSVYPFLLEVTQRKITDTQTALITRTSHSNTMDGERACFPFRKSSHTLPLGVCCSLVSGCCTLSAGASSLIENTLFPRTVCQQKNGIASLRYKLQRAMLCSVCSKITH